MQPRLDTPYEPVISSTECWIALSYMEQMACSMVESGDLPEEIVDLLDKFSRHVREVLSRREERGNTGKPMYGFSNLIWLLPTYPRKGVTRRDLGAAIVELVEERAKLAHAENAEAHAQRT